MNPNADCIEAVHARQLQRAATLRECGHDREADLLEKVVIEYRQAIRRYDEEQLTVAQAAEETGYSAEHLRQLVRTGKLPDPRPPGSQAQIRIRRGDLPRKPWSDR